MIKARLEKKRHCKRIHLLLEEVCKGHGEFLLADILNGDRRHLLWKNITVIMRARVASVRCWCKKGEIFLNIFKLSFGSSSFVSFLSQVLLCSQRPSSPCPLVSSFDQGRNWRHHLCSACHSSSHFSSFLFFPRNPNFLLLPTAAHLPLTVPLVQDIVHVAPGVK